MTNKRKIQILKKVIKRFEKLLPKFDKDKYAYEKLGFWQGICNYAYWEVLTTSEQLLIESDMTGYFQTEFKIKMPDKGDGYKWKLNKRGYKARINACKKAIERLSK